MFYIYILIYSIYGIISWNIAKNPFFLYLNLRVVLFIIQKFIQRNKFNKDFLLTCALNWTQKWKFEYKTNYNGGGGGGGANTKVLDMYGVEGCFRDPKHKSNMYTFVQQRGGVHILSRITKV